MGTSSGKVNKQIAKMLKNTSLEQFEELIPQIKQTIKIKKYIEPGTLRIVVNVGIASAGAVLSGSGRDYDVPDLDLSSESAKWQIADFILNKINRDNPEAPLNDLVKKAFRLAMVTTLVEGNVDSIEFTQIFMRSLIESLFESECGESFITEYGEEHREDLIESIMAQMEDEINSCIKGAFENEIIDPDKLIALIETAIKGKE